MVFSKTSHEMDFSKHIKSLLIANDRLCIPGLGTFVTRYKPAEIVQGMNLIKPPSKDVAFDPEQKKDETGSLASYIARQEKISILDAHEKIRVFVVNILERIQNDRDFRIKDIGTFSFKDGKILFKAELTTNLYAESYGLPDVSTSGEAILRKPLEPKATANVSEESLAVAVDVKKPDKPAGQKEAKKSSGNGIWILIGISIPVLAVLIIVFLILPNTEFFADITGNKRVSITTGNDKSIESDYVSDVEKYIDTVASQQTALKFDDEKPVSKPMPVKENKPVADNKYAHCRNFYIIAGSFQNRQLARSFMNRLRSQGYQAEILVKGDTNRVYIKKFSNRQEALKDLEQLQASGMNVWLLSQ